MFKRKLRKLMRDPKQFLSDMALKHRHKLDPIKPKVQNGNYKYTVVSAVYNVGRYLEDYFESLVKQRLDFSQHVYLIMVDDGSSDNSAAIIKKWQARFPNNITYIKKENGGQASARNLGLLQVKTEWVTFIDPDDFIDRDYFFSLDSFLHKNSSCRIDMAACNLILYHEAKNKFSDTHALRFKFSKSAVIKIKNIENRFQLFTNSAIFKSSIILSNKLVFDENVKPNFEDGKFISEYLLYSEIEDNVAYIKEARYYYRKREDGSSTLDKAWLDVRKYHDVLEYGYLDLLKTSIEKQGHVPEFIQNAVMYDLFWHIKRFVNHQEKISFLGDDEIEKYVALIENIFSYIDEKIILEFNLAGSWFYHKVGMLARFKGRTPDFQIVYLEAYDRQKQQVQLRYFCAEIGLEHIYMADTDLIPDYAKTINHDFLGSNFVRERRLWVHLPTNGKLTVDIAGQPARLSLGGKHHSQGLDVAQIKRHFANIVPKYDQDKRYIGAWLLMDRDTQADDNAEHLYRYIRAQYPEQAIFFVLQQNSHDWQRLSAEGFNLLDYGSTEHEAALKSCSKLISSHLDHYVSNFLGPKMMAGRHLIFLQHGVTKDDLSDWLNSKEQIDCIVTTSAAEYHSFAGDDNRYKYTAKEVALTGFPRHDSLLQGAGKREKLILLMPTWRKSAIGKRTGNGSECELNPDFMQTSFAQHWSSVLHHPRLRELCASSGYQVLLFPHAYIQPYLAQFSVPEFIEVVTHAEGSMQELFKRAAMMITDYSSVAFEMGIQGKSVLYYQFDEAEVFSGGHNYAKGYFDYRLHGFGPVVTEEEALFEELATLLANEAQPSAQIQQRIAQTFPFRDGNSCERVYQAICALDAPRDPTFIDLAIAQQYAEHATAQRVWRLAEQRWRLLQEHGNAKQQTQAVLPRVEALREIGRVGEAEALLDSLPNGEQSLAPSQESLRLLAARHQWSEATACWQKQAPLTLIDWLCYVRCLAETEQVDVLGQILVQPWIAALPNRQQQFALAWSDVAQRDYAAASARLESVIAEFDDTELAMLKPQLLLSRCLREQGLYDAAQGQLSEYLNHTQPDPQWRQEKILLSVSRAQWKEVVVQSERAYQVVADMPEMLVVVFLNALCQLGLFDRADATLAALPTTMREAGSVQFAFGNMLLKSERWIEAVELWTSLLGDFSDAPFRLALAYRMTGQLEKGLALLQRQDCRAPKSVQEWQLMAELAQLTGQWQQAAHCWAALLRFYPEQAPTDCWDRLNTAQMLLAIQGGQKEVS
ncbi:CDP-glycerol glycerophosphotransferase family protein [Aeromonas veronii]